TLLGATLIAPDGITGEWVIEAKPGSDSVYLTIQRHGDGEHFRSTSSFDLKQDSLKGLSSAAMQGSGSPVQFQIVRDAGIFNCEGWFKGGRGSGHFTFAASPSFAGQMDGLGYGRLSDEKLFSLAVLDVGLTFIRDLAALGYDHL